MSRLAVALVAAIACASSAAQERPFLPKAEVESLASGKKWTQTFKSGRVIVWDLTADGRAQTNYTQAVSNRQGTANGKWTVDEQGQLCVVWTGGYPDRCVLVVKEDERLKLVDPKNPTGTFAMLTVE